MAVIADYERGAQLKTLLFDHQISLSALYNILRRERVPRRNLLARAGHDALVEPWKPTLRPEQAPSVADFPESTNGRIGTARPNEPPDALILCAYYGLIGSRERAREVCN